MITVEEFFDGNILECISNECAATKTSNME